MQFLNIYDRVEADQMLSRINALTPQSSAQWGKMNVGQMLAHCNVAFDMAFTDKYKKPNAFVRFMLKTFVKPAVVGPKPYKKNTRTAPEFIITDERNFEVERQKLVDYINKVQSLGQDHFEGRSYHSFGKMTAKEWNVSFAKHLDHHLTQFGV